MADEDVVDISLAVKYQILQDPWLQANAPVFVNRLPQGKTGGSLCLWIVAEEAPMTLDGPLEMDVARIQLDAYGVDQATARKIAVRTYKHLCANFGKVWDEVFVKGVSRARGISQSADRVLLGTDQYRFIASQDLLFTYDSNSKVTT